MGDHMMAASASDDTRVFRIKVANAPEAGDWRKACRVPNKVAAVAAVSSSVDEL
jgi:hypothetical protein